MADSATKQSTPTYVGTSKVVETDYPVSFCAIGGSMDGLMGSLLMKG